MDIPEFVSCSVRICDACNEESDVCHSFSSLSLHLLHTSDPTIDRIYHLWFYNWLHIMKDERGSHVNNLLLVVFLNELGKAGVHSAMI